MFCLSMIMPKIKAVVNMTSAGIVRINRVLEMTKSQNVRVVSFGLLINRNLVTMDY